VRTGEERIARVRRVPVPPLLRVAVADSFSIHRRGPIRHTTNGRARGDGRGDAPQFIPHNITNQQFNFWKDLDETSYDLQRL
jgi:hypothetical protein